MTRGLIIGILSVLSTYLIGQNTSMRILTTFGNCIYETHLGTGTVDPSIGRLTVGNLVSDDVTLDQYVIDWYLNDTADGVQFTTGYGNNPDYTYEHPLTGNAALPVEPGEWIPLIRYIIVGGRKLIPIYRPWEDFCELDTITVDPYDCDNGGTGNYSHEITYNCILNDPEQAEQEVHFSLTPDILWFAIRFWGYVVADRITVYYHDSVLENDSLLEDIVCGTELPYNSWTITPKYYDNYAETVGYGIVIDLSGFDIASGDYIKIIVQPSYIQPPNPATNWRLQMKCGNVSTAFTCYNFTSDMQTIDTSTILTTWAGGTNCAYRISGWTLDVPVYFDFYYTDWYKYYATQNWAGGFTTFYTDSVGVSLNWSVNNSWYGINSSTGCDPPLGQNWGKVTLDWTKSTHTFVLDCEQSTMYNEFKSEYNTIIVNADWLNYTSDSTSYLHYKYFYFWFKEATSCGDPYTNWLYHIEYESEWTFDDVNYTITIELPDTSLVGIVEEECDNTYSTIYQRWVSIWNTYNANDFHKESYVKYATGSIQGLFCKPNLINQVSNYNTNTMTTMVSVHEPVATTCDWVDPWTFNNTYLGANASIPIFSRNRLFAKIIPADTEEPLNNMELYDGLDSDGSWRTHYCLIYKILEGSEIPGWAAGTYNTGDRVINVCEAWESLTDSNTEEPVAESSNWHKISSY